MRRAVVLIRPEPKFRRDAFVAGFEALGFEVLVGTTSRDAPAPRAGDVLVIWTRHEARYGALAEAWEKAAATVLVAENGYLAKAPFCHREHFAIARGDHNGAGWFPYCDDPAPPEDRWAALGIELEQLREPARGGHLVIREQRGIGSKIMASPRNWHREIQARLAPRWSCRIREHPGLGDPARPLRDDIAGCFAVVTWASSIAVRALILGAPVVICARFHVLAARAWNTSATMAHGSDLDCVLQSLAARPNADVDRFVRERLVRDMKRRLSLRRMAWAQWHVEEIAKGLPFTYLVPGFRGRVAPPVGILQGARTGFAVPAL